MKLLKKKYLLSTTAMALVWVPSVLLSNPEGGTVVVGGATITTPDDYTLQIDQSTQSVIIDWDSFNIDANETTQFVQPNSDAWALNRVVGSTDPSLIVGNLQANGNVIVVNPDGIHFGPGSRVDVNRLIATTHDIRNDDFLSGNFAFNLPGNPTASIVNEGDITIADYGLGAFVAPAVRNSGTITARFGQISLASGNQFTIDPYGDGLISLAIDDEIASDIYDLGTGEKVSDLVNNEGTISANGGTVALTAATARQAVNSVINNTGVIEANTVGIKNGKIILGAQTASTKTADAPAQTVQVSGSLNASATATSHSGGLLGRGGYIVVTGEGLVFEAAQIDASGFGGGGTILLGGDYMGGNGDASIMLRYGITQEPLRYPTSTTLSVDAGTSINANALSQGDGGKVILWSDTLTDTSATISARGGAISGDGGFVETSGELDLNASGSVDAGASNGNAGTWLLDPTDVTVDNDGVSATLNTGTNVLITATNDITFSFGGNPIQKTSGGNASFELNAGGKIFANDVEIISTSGELDISMTSHDIWANFSNVQTNGGDFTLEFNQFDLGRIDNLETNGGDVSITSNVDRIQGLSRLHVDTGGGDFAMSSPDQIIVNDVDIDLGGGNATFSATEVGFCRPMCGHVTDPNFEYRSSAYHDLNGTAITHAAGVRIADGTLNVVINGVDVSPGTPTPPTPTDNPPTAGTNTINQITYENGSGGLAVLSIPDLFADDNGVQNLTITFAGVPTSVSAIANGDGTVSFTSSSGVNLPVGSHTITITATDGVGQSAHRAVILTILANPQTSDDTNTQTANLWNAIGEQIVSLTEITLDSLYGFFESDREPEVEDPPLEPFPSYGSIVTSTMTNAFFEFTNVPGGGIISAALTATDFTLVFKTNQIRVQRVVHDTLVNEVYGLFDSGGNIHNNLRELIIHSDRGYLKAAYTENEKILLEQFVIALIEQRVANGELDRGWADQFISVSIDIENLGY